jgi:hypothetical protein
VSAIGTSLAPFSIAGQRSGGIFITETGAGVFLLLSGAMVQAVGSRARVNLAPVTG